MNLQDVAKVGQIHVKRWTESTTDPTPNEPATRQVVSLARILRTRRPPVSPKLFEKLIQLLTRLDLADACSSARRTNQLTTGPNNVL